MTLLLDDDDDCVVTQPPTKMARTEGSSTSFRLYGGNGVEKMSALAYGTARVQVDNSKTPSRAVRSATPASQSKGSPSASSVDHTQAKVLSPSSPSLPQQQRRPSEASASLTPAARALNVCDDVDATPTLESIGSAKSAEVVSQASAPSKAAAHSSATTTTTTTTAKAAAVAAGPKQTNLMDFFSKMKCKK